MNNHFYSLDKHSDTTALFYNFTYSKRDACIAVTHRHNVLPSQLLSAFSAGPPTEQSTSSISAVTVNLFTVTQDYTFRCSSTFTDGWENGLFEFSSGRPASDAGGGDSRGTGFQETFTDLINLTSTLFNPLQTYLLTSRPSFLHVLRVDKVPAATGGSELIFTVEVARRYKYGRESDVAKLRHTDISHWAHHADFSRRQASTAQITLWAIQDLVPTEKDLDEPRLMIIQAVIDSELIAGNVDSYIGDTKLPVVVAGINRVSLLRVRNSKYQYERLV